MLQYLGLIKEVGSFLIKPITKYQDRKAAKESGQQKLDQIKLTGDQSIQLSDAEWEAVAAKGMMDSWKDEYLTVVITAPIPMILFGAVYQAFTADEDNPNGDTRMLEGTTAGIKALGEIGVDLGFLMSAVVLSGVGLKMWRNR